MQSVEINLDDLFRMMGVDRIDQAVKKVLGIPGDCEGRCFPIVHRGWMTWPPFEGM